MEDRYSSISYYEIPNADNSENQVEEGGSVPAAAGTPESSMLGTKRFIPEAPEGEKEEPEGPLREQDLKEAYIELIRGVQEWQDGCVYRGEFGLDVKLGCGEFSWPTGEDSLLQVLLRVWPLHWGAPYALHPLLRDPDLQRIPRDQSLARLPQEGLPLTDGHRENTSSSVHKGTLAATWQ
ncbi:ankyrin repeat and MYND domain-containing protein 1 isoform X2 [Eschrichtius robustus]|uniref:ankyrin repeat and MYND domain-containing protein 1 isoform X2 n=1 Tax=Eschrichtius robustus TaxID=9764 RepID=UPI0035C23F4F